jgi:hypothetical protein
LETAIKDAKHPTTMREAALETLAEVYRDAMQLANESKRAIDSFTGPIPEDSPYRYLRLSVGDAIICFLTRQGKPRTISELVQELQDGHCVLGVIKPPAEIVTKVVKAYIQTARLVWMNKNKNTVGLPAWALHGASRKKRR